MLSSRLRTGGAQSSIPSWGKRAVLNVQSGTIALAGGVASNTATIVSVPVNQTEVYVTIRSSDNGATASEAYARLTLTNTTTLTLTRNDATGGAITVTASYFVVSRVSGSWRSVQYFTASLTNGNATGTATVTAVIATRATIVPLGCSTNQDVGFDSVWTTGVVTNGTTLTFTRTASAGDLTVGGLLLEAW